MRKSLFFLCAFCFLFFFAAKTHAADLFVSPESGDLRVGQQFEAIVRIRAGSAESLNAAEGKMTFSKDLLEIVSISRENSVFNFWLVEPTFSNENGTIEFTGGVAGGISGASLELFKITFRVKAIGIATVNISKGDSAISANDGRGTNILLNAFGGRYTITPALPPPPPGVPPPPPPPPAPIIPPPVQIVRPVVPAVELPGAPALNVVLYPDSSIWYNRTAPFLAQWTLPETITGVLTTLDRNSTADPTQSEGLFESKIFPALQDGINYLHVRFQNTRGRGATAHYRLAIDTAPPLPVEITVREGNITDNPQPTITYVSGDHVSGIDHYEIWIPGRDPIRTNETTYKLPLLPPGTHTLRIRAVDKAGNFSEGLMEIEITPIESPEITFIQQDIFVGETSIPAKGTALPNARVIIFIKKDTGETLFTSFASTNNEGNWEAVLTPQLMKGMYYAEVRAQDSRGALSLPVRSPELRVRERPAFVIGNFEVSQFWLFTGLIIILVGSFSSGFITYRLHNRKHRQRIADKIIIAERDIHGSFSTINQAMDKFSDALKDGKVDPKEVTELKFGTEKLKKNLEKMEEYIVEGIEEIKD